ncbi:MAG TPA: HEAT repeat domain-containing protein, partial [Planctomycetota bacterium]|nr:HEAT repeat domain-containing protein [Planctomycetota bacterium]
GDLHAVETRWEQVNKEHKVWLDRYNANKADKDALKKANDLAAQSREASDRAAELRAKLQEIDPKLRNAAAIRRALVDTLRSMTGAALDRLQDQLKSSKDWETRAGIATAFEQMSGATGLNALTEAAAQETEPTVRIAILNALGTKGTKNEGVLSALREGLKEAKVWQVMIAALQSAVRLGAHELLSEIIDAFAGAEGRLVYDFSEGLARLTGVDKGIKADAWRAWFEANREQALSGRLQPPKEYTPGKPAGKTEFFGIPVTSTRVVFVLDRSGSMMEPADWVPEIGTGEGLPPELRQPQGTRKIDIARWQLKKVIHLMPKGALFNIIFYNSAFDVFKPRMIKLTDATRKEAFAFIDGLDPFGQTNIFDSVERAMQFATGKDGRLDKDAPDTIYLLSDGLPNQGKFTNVNDILREVKTLNAALKMTLNAIWVDKARAPNDPPTPSGEEWMRRLAEENGGKFVSSPKK